MIHFCCGCGNPCDCWAFDQSHGDVCDKCSDCLNNFETKMKPSDYIYIKAWGIIMSSLPYYIEGEQSKAATENAPGDAIYKSSRGEWVRLSTCSEGVQADVKKIVKGFHER